MGRYGRHGWDNQQIRFNHTRNFVVFEGLVYWATRPFVLIWSVESKIYYIEWKLKFFAGAV